MFVSNLFIRLILVSTVAVANGLPPASVKRCSVASKPMVRWAVEKGSTLRVEGKSNISNFRCDIDGYFHTDTITSVDDGEGKNPVRLKGAIIIDIFRFDCHHKLITNDLRKTLKAESFPRMTIRFLTLQKIPEFIGNTELVSGVVEIELAGSIKRFEILYSFVKPGGNIIYLNGGRTFSFADFKLTPPRKLAGFIQINDAFDVNFRLKLTPV